MCLQGPVWSHPSPLLWLWLLIFLPSVTWPQLYTGPLALSWTFQAHSHLSLHLFFPQTRRLSSYLAPQSPLKPLSSTVTFPERPSLKGLLHPLSTFSIYFSPSFLSPSQILYIYLFFFNATGVVFMFFSLLNSRHLQQYLADSTVNIFCISIHFIKSCFKMLKSTRRNHFH